MNQQPIAELARAIITQIAPRELPLFGPVSRAWFADPKPTRLRAGGDKALGYGLTDTIPLITPFVLVAVTQVASYLSDVLSRALADTAKDAISERVARLFRRDSASPTSLSQAQLSDIRKTVMEVAHAAGVSDQQSSLVADALVGHLAGTSPAAL
jgi:hypothetical protein